MQAILTIVGLVLPEEIIVCFRQRTSGARELSVCCDSQLTVEGQEITNSIHRVPRFGQNNSDAQSARD